ncbi:MAG: hypothetical protein AUK47_04005 [Deltaproteobacteria bacterium CG2_30_63_29]|nr:MAG: hypothetical protein AUK47_04005 [Deltaproteobacteria bacterium CG2_30_63_29]
MILQIIPRVFRSCLRLGFPLVFSVMASARCADKEEETHDLFEDQAQEVIQTACGCEEGCTAGLCDIVVALQSSCIGKLDEAEVYVDKVLVGRVTPGEPYRMCAVFACSESRLMEVRGTNFTTGEKTLPLFLDPDIPVGCDNL